MEQSAVWVWCRLVAAKAGWLAACFSREVLVVGDEVSVHLSRDQALVLFDWLARTGEAGEAAGFVDQAEQRVFWDIEATLETLLVEPLAADYGAKLETARDRIRDAQA